MKHWMTVREAAEVMGCSRQAAYTRLKILERRLGQPVLVKRALHGTTKTVVSALDIARLHGPDRQLTDLLEIKDSLEALLVWAEKAGMRLEAVCRKLGV